MSLALYFVVAIAVFAAVIFIAGLTNESDPDVIGPFIVVAGLWPLVLPIAVIVGFFVGLWHLGRFIGRRLV